MWIDWNIWWVFKQTIQRIAVKIWLIIFLWFVSIRLTLINVLIHCNVIFTYFLYRCWKPWQQQQQENDANELTPWFAIKESIVSIFLVVVRPRASLLNFIWRATVNKISLMQRIGKRTKNEYISDSFRRKKNEKKRKRHTQIEEDETWRNATTCQCDGHFIFLFCVRCAVHAMARWNIYFEKLRLSQRIECIRTIPSQA